ncbi:MAG: putative NADH-flavin reductase [Candidatus Saccharibacteria bacterium]|nr:putative NADH-flavin reductase [Candidatus Saccharibacteria bacterium]
MKVTVFGSAGKLGSEIVSLLLHDGHAVVAFVHRNNPYAATAGVKVVKGSITDIAAVEDAIAGSDAVISALGSWGTKNKNIVSTGTQQITKAMTVRGVRRIVTVTGAGALAAGDTPGALQKLQHSLLRLVAGSILIDGETHLKTLESSQLAWTCVRSPVMTKFGKDGYRLRSALPPLFALVPRTAVARCMVDQLTDETFLSQAPVIYPGRA